MGAAPERPDGYWDAIKAAVDCAPPLTHEQIERIRPILQSGAAKAKPAA